MGRPRLYMISYDVRYECCEVVISRIGDLAGMVLGLIPSWG